MRLGNRTYRARGDIELPKYFIKLHTEQKIKLTLKNIQILWQKGNRLSMPTALLHSQYSCVPVAAMLHHRLTTNGVKTVARLLTSVWRHKLVIGPYDLHGAIAPIVRTGIIFNEVLQVAARNVNRLRPKILAYRAIKDWKCFSL